MTDSPDDTPEDPSRRRLLAGLGLAVSGAALVLPGTGPFGIAHAQDDDGGDDDGGDDGGGDDGGGRGSSTNDRRGDQEPRSTRAETPRAPRRQATPRQPRPQQPPPELLALLPPGIAPAAVSAVGLSVVASTPGVNPGETVVRIRLSGGLSADDVRGRLSALSPAVIAGPNDLYTTDDFVCTDGSCAAQQMVGWSGWPSAWAPKIGMIDTGINTEHEALQGQKLRVLQVDLGDRPVAGRQHGTAIATLLLGRMDSRTPGLLPNAELIAAEAFHIAGGAEAADAFTLARSVERMVAEGVSVINMSFSGPDNPVLHRLVQDAAARGIALVAAAGNGGPGAAPAYPAAWPEVVAVTALDSSRRAWRQANRGPYIAFAAPGVGLWTAASIRGGRLKSGTSYAAPFVTATIAVERMRFPDRPPSDVVADLIACADDLGEAGYDPVYGHGLVPAPGQCFAETGPYLTSGTTPGE